MKKKNGFIAISIIYSFFLCFVMLMTGLLANYASAKIILNRANEPLTFEIKKEGPVKPDETTKILLKDKIMGDNTLKSGIPNFNINDTMGFYQSNDNSGNSYYFRGAVTNNYVSFADLIWRVVRINGDNSIRLVLNDFIYNGDTSHCRFVYSDSHSALGKGADFFVGYTFNNPHTCTNNNPCTDKDGTASTMKKTLESWYSNNLQDYDKYIATS